MDIFLRLPDKTTGLFASPMNIAPYFSHCAILFFKSIKHVFCIVKLDYHQSSVK